MAATRKSRQSAEEKKLQRIATKHFRRWLASEGETLLTLSPEKYRSTAVTQTSIINCPFSIGPFKFKRTVQRSFRLGKATVVPTVLVKAYLDDGDVVVWNESIRVDSEDSILDAEVIV